MSYKKAVIITTYPFPGFAATSNRIQSLARGLSEDNYFDVIVIGPGPDNTYSNNKKNKLFSIINVNKRRYIGNNLLIRAYIEIKLTFELLSHAKRNKPDIIIVSIPSIFLLSIILFKKYKIPIVIDLRDLVWEYFINKSYIYKILGYV